MEKLFHSTEDSANQLFQQYDACGRIMRALHAVIMVLIMGLGSLSGCFGEDDVKSGVVASDLSISPKQWSAGEWQWVEFTSKVDLVLYVPHFVKDTTTGYIQNGTIVDVDKGDSVEFMILPSARLDVATLFIADSGNGDFPIRAANESWKTWMEQGTPHEGSAYQTTNADGGVLPWTNTSAKEVERRTPIIVEMARAVDTSLDVSQGQAHSEGWVDGRTVYEWIDMITDETPDPLDPADFAKGYLNRWIGNGNPAYEDAVTFFSGVLEGYGLDVIVHRFQAGVAWAVNICGYKTGTQTPNEWLVFGAHFDIAPPAAYTPGPDIPGYGTRTGAYDNTAGSSMILETAESLSKIDTRRTMVFCLWSSEEEGLWGSTSWTENISDYPEIKVTNYVNLDMMGINWPGDWVLSCYIGPEEDPDVIDQKAMYELAEWVGAGQLGLEKEIAIGWDAWSADGEAAMWTNQYEDAVAIYESPTARSDHDPFQSVLGTITMGFNGVVDGYPCYHRDCDRLSQMESYMVTDDATGEQNLVESFDVVAWWATMTFLTLDQEPILNEI